MAPMYIESGHASKGAQMGLGNRNGATRTLSKASAGDDKEQRYSLLYQLTRITKDRGCLRHNDRLDAFAHGVRWFREALRVDSEAAEREHRRKEEEARWGGWFAKRQSVLGAGPRSSNATRSRHRR